MSAIDEFLILFRTQVQDGGLNRLNSRIKSTRNELFSMRNLLRGFIGYDIYSAVRQFIPQMIDTSRQMGAIHARLFAVTNDTKLANQEFQWLADTTNRLGLELMGTANQYSIFAASAKSTLTGGEIRETFNDMMEAQRVLHLNPETMSRVFYAYREIASEGTLRLTRLTRQLAAALPGAMDVAMKSMGYKTVESFREDISAAKISSRDFLLAFSRGYKAAYVTQSKLNEAMEQVDAQIQLLQRHWQGFMLNMASSGFNKDLINTLKGLNHGLGFLEKHAGTVWKTLKGIGIALVALGLGKLVVDLLFLIGKFRLLIAALIELRSIITSLQFISGASVGAGFVPAILGFILNPAVWVTVLVIALLAGLALITKKFFPNVWKDIMAILSIIEDTMGRVLAMIRNSDVYRMFKQVYGEQSGISQAQNKKVNQTIDNMFPNNSTAGNVSKGIAWAGFSLEPLHKALLSMLPQYKMGMIAKAATQATIHNIFQPKTTIQNLNIQTNSDNAQIVAEEINKKLDERDQKQYKTWQDAVAGSKAHAFNPLSYLYQ